MDNVAPRLVDPFANSLTWEHRIFRLALKA